jgi:hypothetical protein
MSAQDDASTNQRDATRDAVTDAMDAYLMEGVEAVEAWVGSTIKGRDCAAAYTLGCALIHAAHVIAQRLTARQTQKGSSATGRTEGKRPETEPAAKSPTVSARDPELLRMEREAGLATPMPEDLKAKAAIWKRETVGDSHRRPSPTR